MPSIVPHFDCLCFFLFSVSDNHWILAKLKHRLLIVNGICCVSDIGTYMKHIYVCILSWWCACCFQFEVIGFSLCHYWWFVWARPDLLVCFFCTICIMSLLYEFRCTVNRWSLLQSDAHQFVGFLPQFWSKIIWFLL